MHIDIRILALALCGISGVIYLVFLTPPLTSGGNALMPGMNEAELTQAVRAERAFCEGQIDGVDCACFANKAGIVMASEGARVPGAIYVDQQQLARQQAADSC